jgi:hypothetical protein
MLSNDLIGSMRSCYNIRQRLPWFHQATDHDVGGFWVAAADSIMLLDAVMLA